MPIVEPEILPDGDHDLKRCQYVTEKVSPHLDTDTYRRDSLTGSLFSVPGSDAGTFPKHFYFFILEQTCESEPVLTLTVMPTHL